MLALNGIKFIDRSEKLQSPLFWRRNDSKVFLRPKARPHWKRKKRELKEQAVYRPKVETNCEKSDVLNYSV